MAKLGSRMLAAALVASTATAQAAPDPAFCAVLQDFVKSVRPEEAKEITFRTSWGRGLDGSPDRFSEKACLRRDEEPSVKLCRYLVEHGSAEFTGVAVKHALMCLSPQTRLPQDLSLEQGTFRFSIGNPDRGAWVDVVFGEESAGGIKSFRLKVRGY